MTGREPRLVDGVRGEGAEVELGPVRMLRAGPAGTGSIFWSAREFTTPQAVDIAILGPADAFLRVLIKLMLRNRLGTQP